MKAQTRSAPPAAESPVEALTRQRTLLQRWLTRLDEVQSEVPPHVSERVRADYQQRLQAVTEELGAHRDAVLADLEARRADLVGAESRLAAARDALEEARLRHLIGELAPEAWEERRPALEGDLSAAAEAVEKSRGEVERLDGLVREMSAGPTPEDTTEPGPGLSGEETLPEYVPPAPPASPAPAAAEKKDALAGVDLSWLEEIESPAAPAPGPAPDDTGEDLAFLEELDRAIASSPALGRTGGPGEDADRTLDADRAGMLLCKECGAINEPQSWYCEVCGSEL